ncbi:MAG: heme o synthase [Leptospirales bacterium]|nr:heme o synthase [Leptospirales bacterium]
MNEARLDLRAFYRLLKPGLGLSILITVAPGLLLGARIPSLQTIILTMLGTYLTALSSFVYNQILEVRTDALMERTRLRPLPAGLIAREAAYVLGSTMLGLGLAILWTFVHPLAAIIAVGSFFYYVFIYTWLLKPRTSLNTVLGGVAGAVGPLIGEAAARGTISINGLYLFLLLFIWQPPHFWCLGLRYREDYERAGFPILPVARGPQATLRQMRIYQFALLLVILLGWIPMQIAGPIFAIPSLLVGGLTLILMFRLRPAGGPAPLGVFFVTITHMLVWHLAMAIELFLRLQRLSG